MKIFSSVWKIRSNPVGIVIRNLIQISTIRITNVSLFPLCLSIDNTVYGGIVVAISFWSSRAMLNDCCNEAFLSSFTCTRIE